MTRTSHHSHPTPAFPVYSLGFLTDDLLVLGGGGGASRSGVLNKIKVCKVTKDGKEMKEVTEQSFGKEEDAPMSMAIDHLNHKVIVGVNATEASIKQGHNEHCRAFDFAENKLTFAKGKQTLQTPWTDIDYPYQKFTALNPSSSLIALGTTDKQVSVLTWPGMEDVPTADGKGMVEGEGELVDLDWSADGSWLVVTTTGAMTIYSVSLPGSTTLGEGKGEQGGPSAVVTKRQEIFPPSLDITPVQFRACRFSPLPSSTHHPRLHAILNAPPPAPTPRGKGKARSGPVARKAWAVTFGITAPRSKVGEGEKGEKDKGVGELGKWDVVCRREVGGRPVTSFDVSSDGRLLAFASSDLSIGILDAVTLAPLLKILHAHSFSTTALKFNPSATLLASAGADNTVRLVVVPASFGGVSLTMVLVILAILMLLIALVLARR